ncbi:uncharacterized protein EDB91DRAFT_1245037 [Suillus paluster]|uniref:uncharacterized protein n=1 Tax=Suillus paluster TaxID=48578 RepID=UPI001B866B0B|nr:uncharacterized protein EDB91DRAFT_1245037 [Suillus paluster]KAG1748329.1 hypothetical protein EDB91DRAFT_1245037 [Suillus paluster]
MHHSSFPRSSILVYGQDTIHSLVQSTVIAQVEALLENNRIEDAADLATNFASGQALDSNEAEILQYIHQSIASTLFSQTRFVEAAPHFLAGALDPRILVSYFPELSRPLFTDGEEAEVYDGIAKRMPSEANIDDLIRNYSPHLPPSTREAPAAQEIRRILREEAIVMIKSVLQGFKGQGQYQQQEPSLYYSRDQGDTTSLISHLESTNHTSLAAVEPVLLEAGEVGALCALLRARGDEARVMEIWKGLVEGRYRDPSVSDPLSNMFALLEFQTRQRQGNASKMGGMANRTRFRARAFASHVDQEVHKRKRSRGGPRYSFPVATVTSQRSKKFLEWLVIVRRRDSPPTPRNLHKDAHPPLPPCNLSVPQSSFLAYFISTAPDSPSKRARLKALFALQALHGYNAEMIKSQIVASGFEKVLGLEMALLDGKMGMHRIALRALALSLRDPISAETYARTGGIIVPSKAVEACGMCEWGALFSAKGGPGILEREKSAEGNGELVKMLLEVYMEDGEPQQTTRLLSSQSASLDAVDVSAFLLTLIFGHELNVIPLVPPDWPLDSLSSFLTHSFRRTLHAKHEGQIIKAVCAGQNSKVFEGSYLVFREQGAIIEEADDDEDGAGEPESFNEKDGLAEKIALHLQDQ